MKCQEAEAKISELLDLELDETGSAELFLHLSSCPQCRTFYRSGMRLHNSIVRSSASSFSEFRTRVAKPHWLMQRLPMRLRSGPVAQVLRRRYSISLTTLVLLFAAMIAGTAAISTSVVSPPRVVEKKVQETVYVVQLPQVEINGSYVNAVKSN